MQMNVGDPFPGWVNYFIAGLDRCIGIPYLKWAFYWPRNRSGEVLELGGSV